MIVIVDPKRPTGAGESLSGAKAFFINPAVAENWPAIERHPDFQELAPAEKEDVKLKLPVSVQRYKAIWFTRFY
ncbi:hypothetical protein [Geomesophilobacter sediminis]|uniref:Uncharacterized protein n=1 Tax=Geomesophilobacter sediminis TaxID=2798584 RepID=A0A8J7J6K3_9BACT|nr:hypothetical protein [Geomesophilobacter sediminis]MBJ6724451.1 hypothetical protein [Geomesophilobacter sediminis]